MMKIWPFIVTWLGAVKLRDSDRRTVLTGSKLNQLQTSSGQLYLLAIDSIYEINNASAYRRIDLPSDQVALASCMRVGGICRNHVNHVFVSDDKKYACGTDSGLFQCVNVQSPTERFHAKPLSKEDTVIDSVETRNGQLVITAGPDGVQMSRFKSKKFEFVGEALTSPKVPRQVLASFASATNHYYIGRRWDDRLEKWSGFVASLCLNDPRKISDRRTFISTVQRDIECCDSVGCYQNLVSAVVRDSTFIGVFHDQMNKTSTVCQFDNLGEVFSEKEYSKRGAPVFAGQVANLAQCQVYRRIDEAKHLALSEYSSPDLSIRYTYQKGSIIPQRQGKIRHVAVGESPHAVLVYDNRIEKYSLIDGKWLWNIELQTDIGRNSKAAKLFGNRLYISSGDKLESVNLVNCGYYQSQASCLVVRDAVCGWNEIEAECQKFEQNKNLVQNKNQVAIEYQRIQKKIPRDGPVPLVVDTSRDVFDSLEWFDPFQAKMVASETNDYTWLKGSNKTQLLVDLYATNRYQTAEKLHFTLHYKIRNETTKMIIFELGPDPSGTVAPEVIVPMTDFKEASFGSIVPVIIGVAVLVVIIIVFVIAFQIRKNLPQKRSPPKRFGGSKQASILDSEHSFILHPSISPDLYERERRFDFNIQIEKSGLNNSKPDQESFKSDYMSCSSKDLSSSNSEPDDQPKPDEAIIVFPDGTIGRLKANKLKKLKGEIDDLKLEDGEKALAGTLKRSRRKH